MGKVVEFDDDVVDVVMECFCGDEDIEDMFEMMYDVFWVW